MTNNLDNNLPIAVFDSGMGGLTVLHALKKHLPNEDFIYLGDTARLPYGTKSKDTVIRYALNASQVLVDRQVKLIVVACNTASSVALDALEEKYHPIPVIGVIEAGADKALSLAHKPAIAVIATESTVKWGAYSRHILQKDENREIVEWPCSLLVALAEEGWHDGPLVEEILRKLLTPLWEQFESAKNIALVLGCTHFPVLKQAITKVIDENVIVVDSANAVAERVAQILKQYNLYNPQVLPGQQQFLATDDIDRFQRVAKYFLPEHLFEVKAEWVAVDFVMSDA
jgi:glutamate racemase